MGSMDGYVFTTLVILYKSFLPAYYHLSPETTHRHICNLYLEGLRKHLTFQTSLELAARIKFLNLLWCGRPPL